MTKKQEDIQKKAVQFQILESNLKMLQERAGEINQRLNEFLQTKSAIEELKTTKPEKAMIPLGSGNFIFGTVENSDDIIVGVGSGIAVKKKREEALKILDAKITESQNAMNDITKKSQGLIQSLERIQLEIQELQR
ncbi:MAG: prefoldin subunit alpha [Candidatus Aenigmatarchaeota archaeon]